MSEPRHDPELHALFQAARAAEHDATPPFTRALTGRRPPASPRGRPALAWSLGGGGVLAALLLVVLALRSRTPAGGDAAHPLSEWRSPTAFLLPTPSPSVSFIPRFERAVPGSPLRALDPGEPLGPPLLRSSPL